MVCDFPVPGGPCTTRCEPERTASMASCWLLSASRTSTSRSGSSRSTRLRFELGAHGPQGVGVARQGGDDVVVGEGVALRGEVGHHRELGVREGADDEARGHREVGDGRQQASDSAAYTG